MKIQVTAEHIEQGHRRSCTSCPIALAINAAFHPYPTASVSSYSIDFGYFNEDANKTEMVHVIVPNRPKLAKFIKAFDRGLNVEPFEFSIRA